VVSCGIYVLSDRALRALAPPAGAAYDFKHIVPVLLEKGQAVRAYRTGAHWTDVGNVGSYLDANMYALTRGAAVGTVGDHGTDRVGLRTQGEPVLAPDVTVRGPALVGDGARIGTGVVLDHTVIGPGARVGVQASVREAVLLPGAVVPDGAVVTRTVML
jgi:NDP-sugar pyrophosphorylase family protein